LPFPFFICRKFVFWKRGYMDIETLRHGDIEIWRHEDMKT
jgi:hypothetical protein